MLDILKIQLELSTSINESNYFIFLIKEKENISIDLTPYNIPNHSILFTSPYQNIQWLTSHNKTTQHISFHGDFYCIEYHKKEVACNGLLFNNIYQQPYVPVSEKLFKEIETIIQKIQNEQKSKDNLSEPIIKTYLQLILALCSKEKSKILQNSSTSILNSEAKVFQKLLNIYFIEEKSPSFYASKMGITTSTLSKKIKKQFGKTPTQIIQDRTILEAKKQLHLTHKSIKEIAFNLNFEDEFYFSRYFKKAVGISPSFFRKNTGISVVAK